MVLRKLADRLVSTANTAASTLFQGPEAAEKIRRLESMGFPAERARHALNATDGDVERAAELLLLGAGEEQERRTASSGPAGGGAADPTGNSPLRLRQPPPPSGEGANVARHNDEQMQRAIRESIELDRRREARQLRRAEAESAEERRGVVDLTGDSDGETAGAGGERGRPKKEAANAGAGKRAGGKPRAANGGGVRSAATANAGKAAAARLLKPGGAAPAKPSLGQTHPHVKVPTKMSDKSKEEQIMRCANRLKPHVTAVDTLLTVLMGVRDRPGDERYRKIDRNNANYAAHVRERPGAEDLLGAMNYRRIRSTAAGREADELRLERHLVDAGLLYLGISALEQTRLSPEYREARRLRGFHAEMRRIGGMNGDALASAGMSESDTAARLQFLSRCPREPPEGRGAVVTVILGEESERVPGGRVSRRFDGDDTLEDVLNWLGGCYGPELLERLRGEEWRLCDVNKYPVSPLDVEGSRTKTLQYLGLFPSGRLGVRLGS